MVDDQLARDAARNLAVQIRLDQGESQINAGGDPGRGPDIAVLKEDAIRIDPDRRVFGLKLAGVAPVGRRTSPIQKARIGEQKSAGADAGDAVRSPGGGAHDVTGRAVPPVRVRAAAGNNEAVALRVIDRFRADRNTSGGHHRAALR